MDGFEAVKFVSGGVTLAAMIAVVLLAALRSTLAKDVDILKTVEGTKDEVEARQRVAQGILEKFHIDTAGMTSADKKELALSQLHERRKRLTVIVMFALVLALVGGGISVVALKSQHESPPSTQGSGTGIKVQISGDNGTNVDGTGNTVIKQ
jgi:hypothetical protein